MPAPTCSPEIYCLSAVISYDVTANGVYAGYPEETIVFSGSLENGYSGTGADGIWTLVWDVGNIAWLMSDPIGGYSYGATNSRCDPSDSAMADYLEVANSYWSVEGQYISQCNCECPDDYTYLCCSYTTDGGVNAGNVELVGSICGGVFASVGSPSFTVWWDEVAIKWRANYAPIGDDDLGGSSDPCDINAIGWVGAEYTPDEWTLTIDSVGYSPCPTTTPTPTTTPAPSTTPPPTTTLPPLTSLCPNQFLVIQICNLEDPFITDVDDSFNVYLNGNSIGTIAVNGSTITNSVFIGSHPATYVDIQEPNFQCPLNKSSIQYFPAFYASEGNNVISLSSTSLSTNQSTYNFQASLYWLIGHSLFAPREFLDEFYDIDANGNKHVDFTYTCLPPPPPPFTPPPTPPPPTTLPPIFFSDCGSKVLVIQHGTDDAGSTDDYKLFLNGRYIGDTIILEGEGPFGSIYIGADDRVYNIRDNTPLKYPELSASVIYSFNKEVVNFGMNELTLYNYTNQLSSNNGDVRVILYDIAGLRESDLSNPSLTDLVDGEEVGTYVYDGLSGSYLSFFFLLSCNDYLETTTTTTTDVFDPLATTTRRFRPPPVFPPFVGDPEDPFPPFETTPLLTTSTTRTPEQPFFTTTPSIPPPCVESCNKLKF